MVFVASFVPSVFCDFLELDLRVLIVFGARPCHFVCDVFFLLVFHGFILVGFSCSFVLCFEGLGS